MSIFDWLSTDQDSRIKEDEIDLNQPDSTEAESLSIHVAKCAKRYRVTVRRLSRVETLTLRLLVVAGLIVAIQVSAHPLLLKFLHLE